MFLMYGLRLVTVKFVANLKAYPGLKKSATVSSSTKVSPLSKNASLFFVATVGLIFVARIPAPLTLTPTGTVRGNISS